MDKNGYSYTRGNYRNLSAGNVVNFADYVAAKALVKGTRKIHRMNHLQSAPVVNISEYMG